MGEQHFAGALLNMFKATTDQNCLETDFGTLYFHFLSFYELTSLHSDSTASRPLPPLTIAKEGRLFSQRVARFHGVCKHHLILCKNAIIRRYIPTNACVCPAGAQRTASVRLCVIHRRDFSFRWPGAFGPDRVNTKGVLYQDELFSNYILYELASMMFMVLALRRTLHTHTYVYIYS